MTALVSVKAYAAAQGKSTRWVERLLSQRRLPGAVKSPDGVWSIPVDVQPLPHTATTDVGPTSASAVMMVPDVGPTSVPTPLGALGTLEEAAAILGTSVHMVRVMAEDPATPFVVRPWGHRGALRVYVGGPR